MKINEQIWTPDRDFARGSGAIELFGSDGTLDQRIPFTNAIMNSQITHAKWRTRRAFAEWPSGQSWPNGFADSEPANRIDRNYSHPWYNNGNSITDRIANFFCTTDERAVVTTQVDILGEITAYCDRYVTYSGTDTLRGTVNLPESMWSPTMAKWVMDWPTHSGNGTFRSLNWGLAQGTYPYVDASTIDARMAKNPGGPSDPSSNHYRLRNVTSVSLRPGTSELWMVGYDSWNGRWYVGWQDISVLSGGTPTEKNWLWNFDFNQSSLRWRPDGTLWSHQNNTGSLIQRNPADGAVLATHTFPLLNFGASNVYAFVFTSDTEMWVSDASLTQNLYRLTRSGTAWTVAETLPIPYGVSPYWLIKHSSGDLIYGQQNYAIRISTAGAVKWRSYGFSTSLNRFRSGEHIAGTDNDYATGWSGDTPTYGPHIQLWRPGGLAVRALLPTAVTKSNLQTMKITYQFDFS